MQFQPTLQKYYAYTIVALLALASNSIFGYSTYKLFSTFQQEPQYTAYFHTFDSGNCGWNPIVSTNSNWILTNTFPNASNEMGEGKFWTLEDYNNYPNNTQVVIESPSFDLSNLQNINLSLDLKFNTENGKDGMRILVSVDGGTFQLLGTQGSGTNWYNGNVSALNSDGWSNDGHSASPGFNHSQFGRSSINLDDATYTNTTVKFRIEFASNGSSARDGVAFDNFLIQGDPISTLGDPTQGPANISENLRLWLKANAGVSVADNTKITVWEDQAYNTALDQENAIADAQIAPYYRDHKDRNLNFNPVVDFDSSQEEYMNGKGGLYSQDVFIVVKSNDIVDTQTGPYSPGRQFPMGSRVSDNSFHEDPSGIGLGSTSARFPNEIVSFNISSFPNSSNSAPNSESYGRSYSSSSDSYNHVLIINAKSNSTETQTEIYKNGKRIDNTTGKSGNGQDLNFNTIDNGQYIVGTGRSGLAGRTTSQLNGKLTEIISYTSPNSKTNKQKIQTYLAIKYGVTLQDDNSIQSNYRLNDVHYLDSQGSIIWDTNANNGYNYDIAGIGRDDASNLYQKQSKSQNEEEDGIGLTSGLLTIGLTDIYDTNNENLSNNTTELKDGEFLIWGNNNGNINSAPNIIDVDMSSGIVGLSTPVTFTGMERVWKVTEIGGDIQKVKISIPQNAVRNINPPGSYYMFISETGVFDSNADYRVMDIKNGILETAYKFNGTKYITFGYAPEVIRERSIYFDGVDDYINAGEELNLNPNQFTISAWIKRDANSDGKTIIAKRDSDFNEGFDFKINGTGNLRMKWVNTSNNAIVGSTSIPINEWHHVAIIYKSETAYLYIDGVLDKSKNLTNPIDNTFPLLIGAQTESSSNRFKGNIDEVRIWKTALSIDELRYIMNQEIEENNSLVSGKILPPTISKNDIGFKDWENLQAYYPMSTYTFTNVKDESQYSHPGTLHNLNTVDVQTAPLPYVSNEAGQWKNDNTWANGFTQTIPGATSIVDSTITVNWNIVKTYHDISIDNSYLPLQNDYNKTVLALYLDNNTITCDGETEANIGQGLTVTHYLSLDGHIDLEGESQLIQTEGSDLKVESSGSIEREQQGTADKFTYNYWSSPVGITSTTANNTGYSLNQILKDGNSNVNFISNGYNGSPTNPITIADYWIWKFANQLDDDYASWQHVRSNGQLLPAEGYTMKGPGSGPISDDQNYKFVGKPNNGDIQLPLNAGNDYLVGNPYPSAMDANKFILDNAPIIEGSGGVTGTLYFWEHWGGGSHNLSDYQGGYATYNLSGSVVSPSYGTNDPDVGTGGTPAKLPGRYIPVSQGFFVVGEQNGSIKFNNSQRVFQKEGSDSQFMRLENLEMRNIPSDPRMKIKLGLNSVNSIHRQILLTQDFDATQGIDWGFDGEVMKVQMDDLFWMIEDSKFSIQGTNNIDELTTFPIGLKSESSGISTLTLDDLVNVPSNFQIYVHNKVTGEYHNLRESDYQIHLQAGSDLTTYEITFSNNTLGTPPENRNNDFQLIYTSNNKTIHIYNPKNKYINHLVIYNILGQEIAKFKINGDDQEYNFTLNNTNTSIYIASLSHETGKLSKKFGHSR
ncbi:MAG: hypothetical protein BM564_09405 [Bacteroidetes bacterium MedPE-SWsnd-G2]|nr:MAG: hypothetical protein BM564_09405 [Bacteroidetes bacterium MedPE-SWsnd-G2]